MKGTIKKILIVDRRLSDDEQSNIYLQMTGNKLVFVNDVDPFKDKSGVALYQLDIDSNDTGGRYNGISNDIIYDAGHFSNCAVFNGTSSFIKIPDIVTNKSTISMWVKSLDSAFLFGFYNIAVVGTNNIRLYPDGKGTDNDIRFEGLDTSLGTAFDDAWHHLVICIRVDEIDIYVDKVKYTHTSTLTGNSTHNTDNMIGGTGYNDTTRFTGLIDQFRIFNRELMQEEVNLLYDEKTISTNVVTYNGETLFHNGEEITYG
jgi:hypothetical protein